MIASDQTGRPFVVDSQRWPLLRVRPPSNMVYERATMEAYFGALEAVLARRRLCGVLLDMRDVHACERIVQVSIAWLARWDSSIRSTMVALAVLVSTPADRERVIAWFWRFEAGYHAQVFEEQRAAVHWLLAEHARHEASFYA